MSWLFGLRKDPSSNAPGLPVAGNEAEDNSGQPQTQSRGTLPTPKPSEAYRFDSSALERAAQAAKDLEKSSNQISIVFKSQI